MDDLDLGATIKGFIAGQKVFNRYTLVRILGRGGMGVVWLARDEDLEREVALKFLPEVLALDKEAIRDLKRETRRSLELTHPHIVRIYDFIQDARTAAISMEYVAGDTLAAKKVEQANAHFEVATIQEWVGQWLDAMQYAHAQAKVAHRDLKPANLMIDGQGRLKVTDFGIAASMGDTASRVSNQFGSSGTPVYMSPQQMMGEKPAVTDDIYAIGATLYELLTGKPPFYSGNVLMQVQNKVPPSMAERRSDLGVNGEPIPMEWEQTIAACLAKEPSDRPQTAGEVAQRLGMAAGGLRGAVASNVSADDTEKKDAEKLAIPVAPAVAHSAVRNPKSAIAKVAIAAGVIILGVAGWYFEFHDSSPKVAVTEKATGPESAEITGEPSFISQGALDMQAKWEAQQEADYQTIKAQIESVIAGVQRNRVETVETAVMSYLESASDRYRDEITLAWTQRKSSWNAARLAAARGGLIVRTTPSGAEVRVGDVALDKSPLTLRDQRLGKYPVQVRMSDYEDWIGEIEVRENEISELNVSLVRSTGALSLDTQPVGIDFALKGEVTRMGRTPAEFNLPTGPYEVTFRRDGWHDQVRPVEVKRNERIVASAEFRPGEVTIESSPPGAVVSSNGQRLGVTPFRQEVAQPGVVSYLLELDGYFPAQLAGQVREGETLALTTELKRNLTEADYPLIYFYRPSAFGGMANTFKLFFGEHRIAELKNGSYTLVRALPGRYRLVIDAWGVGPSNFQLEFEPNQTYYVRVQLVGLIKNETLVTDKHFGYLIQPETVARQEIAKLRSNLQSPLLLKVTPDVPYQEQ